MARTASKMIPLGTKAPEFKLPDVISKSLYGLDDLRGEKGTLIMFICNHCPFVKHVNKEIVRLVNDYKKKGIGFAAIMSNDIINYPQDNPQRMEEVARKEGYTFPYLFDESQQVAKDYSAACTPDFFLFDADLKLVYRGQLDDSRPGNEAPVDGHDLRDALDALLENREISSEQKPSIGCGIKWKEENS